MNKKGFTLIELIGVIVLISLMVLIIVPTVDKVVKRSKIIANEQLEANILLAAQNWTSDHKSELKSLQKGWKYNLLITTLKEMGYIDKNIKLPSTKGDYTKTNCVVIEKRSDNNAKRDVYDYSLEFESRDCVYEFDNNTHITLSAIKKDTNQALNNGEWTKDNVTLIATPSKGFQASNYSYKWFDNNNYIKSTKTNEYNVPNQEVKTFKYTSTLTYVNQSNGNEYSTQPSNTFIVNIDKKAPNVTSKFKYDNANLITISATESKIGSQSQSGLLSGQSIYYALSTSKTTPPSNYSALSLGSGNELASATIPNNVITSLSTGKYYLWIKEGIKDNAGNVSKAIKTGGSDGMAIDNTKPACTLTAPSSITYNSTGNFTLKCTDSGESGIESKSLSSSNFEVSNLTINSISAPSAVTGGYQYTITAKATTGTGTGSLVFKAGIIKDRAGNGNNAVSANAPLSKAKLATPGSCKSLTYNGSAQTLASGATYASYSNNSKTDAGSYTVTVTPNSNYLFTDGTSTKSLSCSIAYAKTATWGSCKSLTYNGSSQTLASGATNASYSNNTRTNAGSQTVTVTPNANYLFTDGTSTKSLSCGIASAKTATWGNCQSLTYNGSSQTLAIGATNASYTNNSRTNAGSQTVTVTPNANYLFTDGTSTKSLSCTIGRKAVAEPSCTARTYNGSSQTMLAAHSSSSGYSNDAITGINAGSYSKTLTLNSNYQWSSGSNVTSNRTKTCSISKATCSFSLSTTSTWNYNTDCTAIPNPAVTSTIQNIKGTDLFSISGYNSNVVDASISGHTIKMYATRGKVAKNTTTTITVSQKCDTTNYTSSSKTITFENKGSQAYPTLYRTGTNPQNKCKDSSATYSYSGNSLSLPRGCKVPDEDFRISACGTTTPYSFTDGSLAAAGDGYIRSTSYGNCWVTKTGSVFSARMFDNGNSFSCKLKGTPATNYDNGETVIFINVK